MKTKKIIGYRFWIGQHVENDSYSCVLEFREFARENMADKLAEEAKRGRDTAWIAKKCEQLREAGSLNCDYLASDSFDRSSITFRFQASCADYEGNKEADPKWFGCRVDAAEVSSFTAMILTKVAKIGYSLEVTPAMVIEAIGPCVPITYTDAREFIVDPKPAFTPRQLTYRNAEAPTEAPSETVAA